MVGFSDMPGPADVAAIQAAGGIIRAAYARFPVLCAELPVQAVNGLQRNPHVRYVELDHLRYVSAQTLPCTRVA
jgi:hypothetical protein